MLRKYLELALLKSNICNQIISRRLTKSVRNWSFLLCAFLFWDWHLLLFIKCTFFLPPCNSICCSTRHMCEAADNYLTGAAANIHCRSPFYIYPNKCVIKKKSEKHHHSEVIYKPRAWVSLSVLKIIWFGFYSRINVLIYCLDCPKIFICNYYFWFIGAETVQADISLL